MGVGLRTVFLMKKGEIACCIDVYFAATSLEFACELGHRQVSKTSLHSIMHPPKHTNTMQHLTNFAFPLLPLLSASVLCIGILVLQCNANNM